MSTSNPSRFNSISWKLAAAFGLVIAAVVVFQVLYFPMRQAKQATDALSVKAESVSALVGHDVVAAFEFGDANAVREVFKGAESDPDLRFLILYDQTGAEFAKVAQTKVLPSVAPLTGDGKTSSRFSGDYLIVSRRVKTQAGSNGTLVAGFTTSRIAAERRANQLTAILIGLAVLLPGLVITLMISRYVGRRLDRLGHMAERVADGDLTMSFGHEEDGRTNDEIERLTNAFDFMASSLKITIRKVIDSEGTLSTVSQSVSNRSSLMINGVDQQRTALDNAYGTIERLNGAIGEISEHVDQLKVVAEETSAAIMEMVASETEIAQRTEHLNDSVSQTSAATAQMVSAIKEVDRNLEYLRGFVTDTSASVAEMNASIAEVENNAAKSYELAQAVAGSADAGRAAVNATIDGMERARNASAKTNEVVARLGQRSSQIGEILTVIQAITAQTNLLALNAAILAAQAGEHGRGFSVVADEIRDLSDRTTTSTKDIEDLINAVQAEVREALTATEDGSQIVDQVARLSHTAGDKLTAILDSASKSLEMGQKIATSTREQARGSETIGEAISRLDDLVKQISGAMSSQTSGATHINRALETMRDVTAHTRHATAEQKSTATRIAEAADVVMTMSQKISALIADHASESGKIVGAMGEVRTIAEGNKESATQMSDSVGSLKLAIQSLNDEVRKFRIEA